jgi:hypothetical protein
MKRRTAHVARALGKLVGSVDNLLGVFVEQRMIAAIMRSADMPVKFLGFELERKTVGQQPVRHCGNFFHRFFRKVGGRIEYCGRMVACVKGSNLVGHGGPRLFSLELL